jgi:hypothetical protein
MFALLGRRPRSQRVGGQNAAVFTPVFLTKIKRREAKREEMLKMNIDPTMFMKTKEK